MSKKKTIVTGGAGFIGSHITERLLGEGHEVTVLDNFSTGRQENLRHLTEFEKLNVVHADISVQEEIAEYFEGVDWVFHIAVVNGNEVRIGNDATVLFVEIFGMFRISGSVGYVVQILAQIYEGYTACSLAKQLGSQAEGASVSEYGDRAFFNGTSERLEQ